MINLVLCCDRYALPGLHVTLLSILSHTEEHIKVYLLTNKLTKEALEHLSSTLSEFKHQYQLLVNEVDTNHFSQLRGIQGNHFTYARLLIPGIIKEDKILYLDVDLVVTADISKLYSLDLGNSIIGAKTIGSWRGTIDEALFSRLNFNPDSSYFNAGVMLLNLNRWRSEINETDLMEFAFSHAHELMSADQSVLNAFFHDKDKVLSIDSKYNIEIYPSNHRKDYYSDGIYHFLGSPKPWDLFARHFILNHKLWNDYFLKTSLCQKNINHIFMYQKLLKAARSIGSYLRAIRNRND